MNLKSRLDLIIKNLGVSGRQFEKNCGLPTGSYSSISDGIGANKLQKILFTYPQISLEYLILGKGEMMKSSPGTSPFEKDYSLTGKELSAEVQKQSGVALGTLIMEGKLFTADTVKAKDEIIELQREQIARLRQRLNELENKKNGK